MSYSVVFSSNAIKDLHAIPREYQEKIIIKAESLGLHPYPKDSLKLKGIRETLRRIRVGVYRIFYFVDDEMKMVDIRRIGHRKEIYQNK